MELPTDLILEILKFIDNTSHLASACLVNRIFYRYAAPLLYEQIAIYSWMKDRMNRVVTLFSTLSRCPNLASFVRSLRICHSPKSLYEPFISDVLNGLQHCINLRSCAWTRDGTITSQILETLSSCPNIHELEVNGHSDRRYDPHLLLRFKNLVKISIIMPSSGVVNRLEDWVVLNQRSLRSLSLMCKESILITDNLLEPLAPLLPNLEHLHITGCPRLTNRSVWALLLSNSEGLLSLSLEGLSLRIYDLYLATEELTQEQKPHPLRRLHSIALSVPSLYLPIEYPMSLTNIDPRVAIPSLLSQSPLEIFNIYPTSSPPGIENMFSMASELVLQRVVQDHAKTLRKVVICEFLVSFNVLEIICGSCTKLEELLVFVAPGFKGELGSCFSLSKTLQTIHINNPPSFPITNSNLILTPTEIISILKQCSSTITQFGCCSEMWEVMRTFVPTNDGYDVQLTLKECENMDIPEQFLVIRGFIGYFKLSGSSQSTRNRQQQFSFGRRPHLEATTLNINLLALTTRDPLKANVRSTRMGINQALEARNSIVAETKLAKSNPSSSGLNFFTLKHTLQEFVKMVNHLVQCAIFVR